MIPGDDGRNFPDRNGKLIDEQTAIRCTRRWRRRPPKAIKQSCCCSCRPAAAAGAADGMQCYFRSPKRKRRRKLAWVSEQFLNGTSTQWKKRLDRI